MTSPTARGCFAACSTPPRPTWNVVARCGDRTAERTLVVLAHHDAAPTGAIFDETAQVWFGEAFPGIIERIDTSLPLWWALLAAPALVALGAARQRPALARAGLAGSLLATAVFADVARSPVCPGANDNLTAVAVLVALAERLATALDRGFARAAGLLRRRGGAPGRDPRIRSAPLPRASTASGRGF